MTALGHLKIIDDSTIQGKSIRLVSVNAPSLLKWQGILRNAGGGVVKTSVLGTRLGLSVQKEMILQSLTLGINSAVEHEQKKENQKDQLR